MRRACQCAFSWFPFCMLLFMQQSILCSKAMQQAALMLQQHAVLQGSMVSGRQLSSFCTSVSGERKSKRARKGRAPVPASSLHTLWDLKLRILEALDVHPRNAAVHAWRSGSWQALGPDEATLAGGGTWLGCDGYVCCWALAHTQSALKQVEVGGLAGTRPYAACGSLQCQGCLA